MKLISSFCSILIFLTLGACSDSGSQPEQATSSSAPEPEVTKVEPDEVGVEQEIIERINAAADWQLAHMEDFESYVPSLVIRTKEPRGWVQGTFYLGLVRWAEKTGNDAYFDYLRAHGEKEGWELGPRIYHGDDHVIAQYYLHMYERDQAKEQIAPLVEVFETILADEPTSSLDFEPKGKFADQDYEHDCQKRWCWSDALFMSPPVWFHLTALTGEERYANYAHKEFQAVTDYLFDNDDGLYVRDSRFFERREENGEKIYWSRGNGWVFAGLTKIMDTLSADDPRYAYYASIFTRMAESLASRQADNGYWPVSLAAGDIYKVPESSGTAFFVAGLAWGVNQGLLEREQYMPVISKGWQALMLAQKEDGMLGYVQQIGYAPDKVSADQTQLYGAGAFLLAGTQMLELAQKGIYTGE